jgi:hypothetical protein
MHRVYILSIISSYSKWIFGHNIDVIAF